MIISAATYKQEFASDKDESIIEVMLEAAQAEVENVLGYSLEAADYEKIYIGADRLISLPHKQINSIDSVVVDEAATTDYQLEGHCIRLASDVTLNNESKVVVQYNAGWIGDGEDSTDTNCPDSLRAAIQLIAQAMLSNIGTGGISPQASYASQGSITYSNDPGKWKKYYSFLEPYRILWL